MKPFHNLRETGVGDNLKIVRVAISAFLFSMVHCHGQGNLQPLHITFDGYPEQPPGTAYFVQQYYEWMWFRPLGIVGPGNGFGRRGGVSAFPENGSAYIITSLGDSLMFSFLDGSVFDLVSVDLAEYSTGLPDPVTVPFIGYRPDGSTVTVSFTTDGIIDGTGPLADFQTFYFGPEFSGLSRVEIPTWGWSLDNLFVSVPEPHTFALLLLAGPLLWAWRRAIVTSANDGGNGLDDR